jgi:hypothetical protein
MKGYVFVYVLLVLGALVIAGCTTIESQSNQTEISGYTIVLDDNSTAVSNQTSVVSTVDEPKGEPKETAVAPENGVVIQATEGDLVQLKPEAVDPDGQKVAYSFTTPFDSNGKWQTKEGDAGTYHVTVTASDGQASSSEEVSVLIKKAKKGPVIECPDSFTVKEGDSISLNCNIYDPEGDQAIVEYSGFMKGPTYSTTYNDAGKYTTIVKAKNQYKETAKTISITVLNTDRSPDISFKFGDTIRATEGDIITLSPLVSDPDGDNASVTFSDPFDATGIWKTKIGDTGTYTANVVASDGQLTSKKEVNIQVAMKNTAPVLKKISDITIYEGETIKLPIDVYDREGDKVNVTVKGWMNSASYTSTYSDAGNYTVTVIASDGQYETSQTFKVTVLDKNRAPVFKLPA